LCPVLKDKHHPEGDGSSAYQKGFVARFYDGFNSGFKALTHKYISSLKFLIAHKWVALSALAVITAITVFLMNTTPKAFVPNEDNNFVVFGLSLPPGASLNRTTRH
jgi:HAE1 family hydrophobic/amphiphilic exporter-1